MQDKVKIKKQYLGIISNYNNLITDKTNQVLWFCALLFNFCVNQEYSITSRIKLITIDIRLVSCSSLAKIYKLRRA